MFSKIPNVCFFFNINLVRNLLLEKQKIKKPHANESSLRICKKKPRTMPGLLFALPRLLEHGESGELGEELVR